MTDTLKIKAIQIDVESVLVRGEDFDYLCNLAESADRALAAIEELKRYFTSGNKIPVEKATIKADDFFRIIRD